MEARSIEAHPQRRGGAAGYAHPGEGETVEAACFPRRDAWGSNRRHMAVVFFFKILKLFTIFFKIFLVSFEKFLQQFLSICSCKSYWLFSIYSKLFHNCFSLFYFWKVVTKVFSCFLCIIYWQNLFIKIFFRWKCFFINGKSLMSDDRL